MNAPGINFFSAMEALAEGCEGVTCDLLKRTYGPAARLVRQEDSDQILLLGAERRTDWQWFRLCLLRVTDWRVVPLKTRN